MKQTQTQPVHYPGLVSRIAAIIKRRKRIIIEGGYHQDWEQLHINFAGYCRIPEVVTTIEIGSLTLNLVGKINSQGQLIESRPDSQGRLKIGYNSYEGMGIERPTTLLVADGIVYHDGSLQSHGGVNAERLNRFLAQVSMYGNRNPVSKMFRGAHKQS